MNNVSVKLPLSLIWTLSDASGADSFLKPSNFSFCHHVLDSIQSLYFHLKGVSILSSGMFSKSSAADFLYVG